MPIKWPDMRVSLNNYHKFVFIVLVILVLVARLLISLLLPYEYSVRSDYSSMYLGGRMINVGYSNQLYDLDIQQVFQYELYGNQPFLLPYRNPPPVALLFSFLSALPFEVSRKLFVFVLCLTSVGLLFKYLMPTIGNKLLLMILFATFLPLHNSILLGQTSVFFTILFFYVYSKIEERQYYFAGLLSGFLILKPQFLIIIPYIYFVINKRHGKRYAKGVVVSVVACLIVSILISGFSWFVDYPTMLFASESSGFGSSPIYSFSLYGLLTNTLQLNVLYSILINTVLYLLSVTLLLKSRISFRAAFVVAILFTIVFSVHLFSHDLLITFIAIWILVKKAEKNSYILSTILWLSPQLVNYGLANWVSVIYVLIGINILRIAKLK